MAASALDILNEERARQRQDACASFAEALDQARDIAAAIRAANRLVLIGMGGSHFINRIVEPMYRASGVEASAHTASELIASPLPAGRRVAIVASQSGASSEVKAYLAGDSGAENRFGLTLERDSHMGRTVPCLVGVGGTERSYAAARSVLITLALHAAILDGLGQPQGQAMAWLTGSKDIPTVGLLEILSKAASFMVVVPAKLRGVGESAGLTLMELSHLPALALEFGQFRHGPLEAVTERTGIILFQASAQDRQVGDEIRGYAKKAGAALVTLDLDGSEPSSAGDHCTVPIGPGIAREMAALLAAQGLAIDLAARIVPDVGEPRLGRKVM